MNFLSPKALSQRLTHIRSRWPLRVLLRSQCRTLVQPRGYDRIFYIRYRNRLASLMIRDTVKRGLPLLIRPRSLSYRNGLWCQAKTKRGGLRHPRRDSRGDGDRAIPFMPRHIGKRLCLTFLRDRRPRASGCCFLDQTPARSAAALVVSGTISSFSVVTGIGRMQRILQPSEVAVVKVD